MNINKKIFKIDSGELMNINTVVYNLEMSLENNDCISRIDMDYIIRIDKLKIGESMYIDVWDQNITRINESMVFIQDSGSEWRFIDIVSGYQTYEIMGIENTKLGDTFLMPSDHDPNLTRIK